MSTSGSFYLVDVYQLGPGGLGLLMASPMTENQVYLDLTLESRGTKQVNGQFLFC